MKTIVYAVRVVCDEINILQKTFALDKNDLLCEKMRNDLKHIVWMLGLTASWEGLNT